MEKPKGYISAYNFFYEARYRPFKVQNPSMGNNELNKVLGQQWKDLCPEERKIWIKRGEEDKIRYLQELATYNSMSDVKTAPRIEPPDGYDYSGRLSAGGQKVKLDPSSRFQSAYNLFVKQEKQMYAPFYVGTTKSSAAMGKSASLRWRSMCTDEKELYIVLEKSLST